MGNQPKFNLWGKEFPSPEDGDAECYECNERIGLTDVEGHYSGKCKLCRNFDKEHPDGIKGKYGFMHNRMGGDTDEAYEAMDERARRRGVRG